MTVEQKQCLLRYLGYPVGAVDGIDGKKTQAALAQFKAEYGVGEEGLPGAVAGTVPKLNKPTVPDASTGTFWDDIEFFGREEFKCKCGGKYCNGYPSEMKEAVVRIADSARKHFGKPAYVVSGLRCKQHNANEGGVANSQHMYGEAIDLRISGVSADQLLAFVKQQLSTRYAYKINATNVHFDIQKGAR